MGAHESGIASQGAVIVVVFLLWWEEALEQSERPAFTFLGAKLKDDDNLEENISDGCLAGGGAFR